MLRTTANREQGFEGLKRVERVAAIRPYDVNCAMTDIEQLKTLRVRAKATQPELERLQLEYKRMAFRADKVSASRRT